jgi:hypothetical protein
VAHEYRTKITCGTPNIVNYAILKFNYERLVIYLLKDLLDPKWAIRSSKQFDHVVGPGKKGNQILLEAQVLTDKTERPLKITNFGLRFWKNLYVTVDLYSGKMESLLYVEKVLVVDGQPKLNWDG